MTLLAADIGNAHTVLGLVRDGEVTVEQGDGPVGGPAAVLVWQLDAARPAWAD